MAIHGLFGRVRSEIESENWEVVGRSIGKEETGGKG